MLIIEGAKPNAFTFGSEEHASVVVSSGTLKLLTERELSALFGHELAHVKSGHMLYHTVAEVLGGGIGVSASLLGLGGILSVPVRLALCVWVGWCGRPDLNRRHLDFVPLNPHR